MNAREKIEHIRDFLSVLEEGKIKQCRGNLSDHGRYCFFGAYKKWSGMKRHLGLNDIVKEFVKDLPPYSHRNTLCSLHAVNDSHPIDGFVTCIAKTKDALESIEEELNHLEKNATPGSPTVKPEPVVATTNAEKHPCTIT